MAQKKRVEAYVSASDEEAMNRHVEDTDHAPDSRSALIRQAIRRELQRYEQEEYK